MVLASLLLVAAAAPQTVSIETFNGRLMTIEWFRPERIGRRPAVLVLHGANGVGERYREVARLLAASGYEVFFPHYFESGAGASRRENFKSWIRAVSDAITFVSHRPGVDGERIGLLGFSLGAYLALSVGVIEPGVGCVVEYFGGLPPAMAAIASRTPPVLILHGEDDRIVPVSEAHRLEDRTARARPGTSAPAR